MQHQHEQLLGVLHNAQTASQDTRRAGQDTRMAGHRDTLSGGKDTRRAGRGTQKTSGQQESRISTDQLLATEGNNFYQVDGDSAEEDDRQDDTESTLPPVSITICLEAGSYL